MIILQRLNEPFKKPTSQWVGEYAKDYYYVVIDENVLKCIQLDKQEIETIDLSMEFVVQCIISGVWTKVTELNPWVEKQ